MPRPADQRYLPLVDGSRWVLTDPAGKGSQTITVTRGTSGLSLRGLPGAGEVRVRAAGFAIQAWDPASSRWEPFLRLGARVGTKYAVSLPTSPLWRSLVVTVVSRQAVAEDADGKILRNCVRLAFATRKTMADAGIEALVFAPGVGIVSATVQTIAGPREHTLAGAPLR